VDTKKVGFKKRLDIHNLTTQYSNHIKEVSIFNVQHGSNKSVFDRENLWYKKRGC